MSGMRLHFIFVPFWPHLNSKFNHDSSIVSNCSILPSHSWQESRFEKFVLISKKLPIIKSTTSFGWCMPPSHLCNLDPPSSMPIGLFLSLFLSIIWIFILETPDIPSYPSVSPLLSSFTYSSSMWHGIAYRQWLNYSLNHYTSSFNHTSIYSPKHVPPPFKLISLDLHRIYFLADLSGPCVCLHNLLSSMEYDDLYCCSTHLYIHHFLIVFLFYSIPWSSYVIAFYYYKSRDSSFPLTSLSELSFKTVPSTLSFSLSNQ